jgi:2,4-dienoyl-CoA reductase-like NADH-dependent reductase (Old Yellow Enzyme family)
MWTPPERIKHKLPEVHWPTQEEAARALWFHPIQLGSITANTRTWVPAMVPWRATDDGFVTQDVIDWYARFAKGRPGVIVIEATGIRDVPSGPLLRIGHDRFIPGLQKVVQAVKEASQGETKLFIQLIDFLSIKRRPEKQKFLERFLRIQEEHRQKISDILCDKGLSQAGSFLSATDDDVRLKLLQLSDEELKRALSAREWEDLSRGYRERVTDTHLAHIKELPQVLPTLFSNAAARAKEAGLDGIELHFAHAYTMASFLSALNTREDGYGGSRENRARLPVEVFSAVRAAVGAQYTVGARFLGDEMLVNGNTAEDAVFFGGVFAQSGFDFLSLSTGGKFEDAAIPKVGEAIYPYTGRSGYECMPTIFSDARGPFGRNVHVAKQVKEAINKAGHQTPIVAAGGIYSFTQAEAILQNKEADIVASARQSLADPDWFLKIRQGRGAEIRRCNFTNYCEALDQRHKQVTCKLWDRLSLNEAGVSLDHEKKRRLVAPLWEGGD